DRPAREEQDVGVGGGAQRGVQPGDAPAHDDQIGLAASVAAGVLIHCHEVFSSKSITCRGVYMVSDPQAKTAPKTSPAHTVLAVVLQVRHGTLQALLWERALEPFGGTWSLPGGDLQPHETLDDSIRRHLAAKVDVQ